MMMMMIIIIIIIIIIWRKRLPIAEKFKNTPIISGGFSLGRLSVWLLQLPKHCGFNFKSCTSFERFRRGGGGGAEGVL